MWQQLQQKFTQNGMQKMFLTQLSTIMKSVQMDMKKILKLSMRKQAHMFQMYTKQMLQDLQ